MLKFVGDPGVGCAHMAEGVQLQSGVDVHIVKVNSCLQRHFVCGEAPRVIDMVPRGVLHKEVHSRRKGLELRHLLKHPREGGLAGEHERAGGWIELRATCLFCGGCPADGHGVPVGVDKFL